MFANFKHSSSPYRWCHDNVRRHRGQPSEYECVEDGCLKVAREWALKPAAECLIDPVCVRHEGKGLYCSPHARDYDAMCSKHHRARDRRIREEAMA